MECTCLALILNWGFSISIRGPLWGLLGIDPVGNNNWCTLYDTIFYKPEDDPKGSKHVALLIVA